MARRKVINFQNAAAQHKDITPLLWHHMSSRASQITCNLNTLLNSLFGEIYQWMVELIHKGPIIRKAFASGTWQDFIVNYISYMSYNDHITACIAIIDHTFHIIKKLMEMSNVTSYELQQSLNDWKISTEHHKMNRFVSTHLGIYASVNKAITGLNNDMKPCRWHTITQTNAFVLFIKQFASYFSQNCNKIHQISL